MRFIEPAWKSLSLLIAIGLSTYLPAQAPVVPGSTQSAIDSAVPNANTDRAPANNNANVPRGTSNANSNRNRLTSTTNRRSSRGDFSSLSSVPYMMGDARFGSRDSIQLQGNGALDIQHPNMGSNRLNIAENESPVIADRIFASYRHYHNASDVDFRGFTPVGGLRSVDIDSWIVGFESTFAERSSIEVRLPINYQLSDNLNVSQTVSPIGIVNNQLPFNNDTSIGNLGIIYKLAMLREPSFYVSSGAGLNLPTAPNVTVQSTIDNPQFRSPNLPNGQTVRYNLNMTSQWNNDTVNVTPFIASAWRPNSSTYGLGFLQLDVPLNESRVSAVGTSSVGGQLPTNINLQGRLAQQLIMRVNLGGGKWLWQSECDRLIHSFGLHSELHYSTTLNDADRVAAPVNANGANLVTLPAFGSMANRLDVLNTLVGVQAVMGQTAISHGFIVPLRNQFDRGYDFEYSLIVNRRF